MTHPINTHPLVLIPGCNTEKEVSHNNAEINTKLDIPWIDQQAINDKPVAIVCGGPSLSRYWPQLLNFPGDIIACNGTYQYLLNREIVPDYFMLLDCREENISFIEYGISLDTTHLIAAQCHPSVFDRLIKAKAKTKLYLTTLPGIDEITKYIDKPKVKLAGCVGTVGIKAMSMAFALGYRKMHLYGYDSSYQDDDHHAYPQPLNDNAKTLDIHLDGEVYYTTPTLANQAQEFPRWAKSLVQDHGCEIELHCDGLLPHNMDYCNRIGEEKSLEDREREKYEDVWSKDQYRNHSPGEQLATYAYHRMGMRYHQSLIDFGCGTGRACVKFSKIHHMDVVGIDHASNCLDIHIMNTYPIPFTFINTCLWDINPKIYADWGYCTDVMEHIPTEKVADVLENISKSCANGCFFNIATRDDVMGSLIGKKLHMTVMTHKAWLDILTGYFDMVQSEEKEGESMFICFHENGMVS
jgi:2-polyprenyl-3-methyl-5-hydroxy-6-metoxy-1,4-benzoquinol methylase